MLLVDCNRMSNVFVDVNVGVKNRNFYIPLILYECNMMIVMQKLQKFNSAFTVECLHSKLQAKLLIHAKHANTYFVAYKRF